MTVLDVFMPPETRRELALYAEELSGPDAQQPFTAEEMASIVLVEWGIRRGQRRTQEEARP